MNRRKHRFTTSVAALSAALLWCGAATAQTAQTALRVADSFPTGHYIAENQTKPWMEKVKELTGGKVSFQYFPAEQLGKAKDLLSLTQTGVVDIGYVAPAYASDKMPVSEVAMLPGAFAHSCQGTLAYWKLARSLGVRTSINPDAHSPRGLDVVRYGVNMARKGWLTTMDVVNAWGLETVQDFLRARRSLH